MCGCAGWVQGWLEQRWSPEQISVMLRAEFPGEPEMRVSHETIYQAIYVQGRGALRRELAACLRTGRALRKPRRRRRERRGRIKDMVMISERPAEADDRAVPGHWEGDLIMGTAASRRSAPWSSGPPGSCCCCTCRPGMTPRGRGGDDRGDGRCPRSCAGR